MKTSTFTVRATREQADRSQAVSQYEGARTVGAWLASLASERVRQVGKLVPRAPLRWRRARFYVLRQPDGGGAMVPHQVVGIVGGPFGIYRARGFNLVHVPTGRTLVTLHRLRRCKSVARELAALRRMAWNEADPERVVSDDGPMARAILETAGGSTIRVHLACDTSGAAPGRAAPCDTDAMSKKLPRKPKDDFTQVAFRVFKQAIGEALPSAEKQLPPKAAAGQKGGLKGGKARAAKLSAARRSDIARRAAKARWNRSSE